MHQIDNYKERCNPAEEAELDEMVFHEALRGGTAETIDNHVLEIA